jgi:hypothetical protein
MYKSGNLYKTKDIVGVGDLIVAEDSEFDLTRDRIYVVKDYVANLIQVKNDKGVLEVYSTEYFRFYEGETIGL